MAFRCDGFVLESPLYCLLETRDFLQDVPEHVLATGARLNIDFNTHLLVFQTPGLSLRHGCRGRLKSLVESIVTTGLFRSESWDQASLFCPANGGRLFIVGSDDQMC